MAKKVIIILSIAAILSVAIVVMDGMESLWYALVFVGGLLCFITTLFQAKKKGLDMRTREGKRRFAERKETEEYFGGPLFCSAIILFALAWFVNYLRPYYWVREVKVSKDMVVDYKQGSKEGSFVVEKVSSGNITIKFDNGKTVTLSDAKNSFCTKSGNPLNLSSSEKAPSNLLLALRKESRNIVSPTRCERDKIKNNAEVTYFKPRK